MAQQIITFDPDVGVPMGVNLTMFSGADFNTTFTIRTSAGSSIDFTNYTGRSNMKKSAIGTANTFGVSLGDVILIFFPIFESIFFVFIFPFDR
ncbi:MAG: hypothetical protein CM15mP10_0810 [Actinomycetota bacterium]|nr:MAG: hypothetical protein CM15mP10_0810 [Actinomycetota bacterium]